MDESKICKIYESGKSISDISENLNISKSKVYRILLKNNINTKRNSSNYKEKLYDYEVDDTFFEKINTEEKAYILGFLYADGNLHKNGYHVKLKLQERDKYILEKMNKTLKSNKPLYFHKKTKETHQHAYSIVLSNKKMYNDLMNLGLYPNKTYDLKFKNVFSDKLFKHFLRGYFDGDGWVCVYENPNKYKSKKTGILKNNKKTTAEVGFTGTLNMCEFLHDYFLKKLDIESKIKTDKRTDLRIKSIKIKKQAHVLKFYNFIYSDCNIFLNRKKEKFENFFNIKNNE